MAPLPPLVNLHLDAGLIDFDSMNIVWSLRLAAVSLKREHVTKKGVMVSRTPGGFEFEFKRGELGNGRANTEKP